MDPFAKQQIMEDKLYQMHHEMEAIKSDVSQCARIYDIFSLIKSIDIKFQVNRYGTSLYLSPYMIANGETKYFEPVFIDNVYNLDEESSTRFIDETRSEINNIERQMHEKNEKINDNLIKIVDKLKKLDKKYLDNAMKDELEDIMNDLRQSVN